MRLAVSVVLAILALLAGSPGFAAEEGFYVGAGEAVRAVTLEYPPYEFTRDGKPTGAAVAVVKEVFRRMEREVFLTVLPLNQAVPATRRGFFDCMFTLFYTPERAEGLLYSKEVLMPQVTSLFSRKGSSIDYQGSLSALADKSFGVVRDMNYGEYFSASVKSGAIRKLAVSPSSRDNVRAFLAGKFDLLVSNRDGAWHYLQELGGANEVIELSPALDRVDSYLVFTRARDMESLKDDYDRTLREMKEDGSYDEILSRWLRDQQAAPKRPSASPK